MKSGAAEFVYRTTMLHEAEMVAEELERHAIAYVRALEQFGTRFAMPISAPIACLPGSWYLVVVRAPDIGRARTLVAALPISHDE